MTYILIEKRKDTGDIKSLNCTAHAVDNRICACLSLAIWGALTAWTKRTSLTYETVRANPETATIVVNQFKGWDDKSRAMRDMFLEQLELIKHDFGDTSFVLDIVEV